MRFSSDERGTQTLMGGIYDGMPLSLSPLIALCLRVSLERESEPLYLLLYFNVMTPPCP